MTGKDLAITLVAAAVVGGAAGFAASYAPAPKEQAPALAPEVAERLKAADDELAKSRAALAEAKKSLAELTERVTAAELRAAKQSAESATQPMKVARRARKDGHAAPTIEELEHMNEVGTAMIADPDFVDAGGQIALQLGGALEGALGDASMPPEFASLRAGLGLRKLPEAERWTKAKDDLGLTWNQVEDLKKAVADRDAALKDAMTKETKTGPNGGTITIQRPDSGKLAHAEANYHDKLNATLGEQQKKDWRDKGYDHAFGSSPFGGAGANVVMAIDVKTDKQGDTPKDAPK
jgi:hypothetical protein